MYHLNTISDFKYSYNFIVGLLTFFSPLLQFVIDYPNEYLISVEGTYNILPDDNVLVIRSLIFKTSKGRISPTYGFVSGTKFVLESQGNAIVGFYGRDGGAFDAIGVYFSPIPS